MSQHTEILEGAKLEHGELWGQKDELVQAYVINKNPGFHMESLK